MIHYDFYTLATLYLAYSFLGWLGETVVATIRGKHFVSRGIASGPFCFVYGFAAVFLTVSFSDLRSQPGYLFFACMLGATVIEWLTSKLLERLHHRRWWDYSGKHLNLNGYICLQYSVLWGILGTVCLLWGNRGLIALYQLLPQWLTKPLLLAGLGIALLDQIGSAILVQRSASHPRLEQMNQELEKYSARLRRRIADHVDKRIHSAYPQTAAPLAEGQRPFDLADLIWLFVIGALIGDLVETLFCRVTSGVWMSRSSLVWGPFSVVWGLALVLATVLLRQEQNRSDRYLFAFGTIMGGVYEYACSAVTELVFGTVFWDYSKFKFNLGGRINLLYCFFWGIAAVVWMRYGYPLVEKLMTWLRPHIRRWMTLLLTLFMAVNLLTSALALARYDARTSGVEARNQIEQVLDVHFDDVRMAQIYPNAKKV